MRKTFFTANIIVTLYEDNLCALYSRLTLNVNKRVREFQPAHICTSLDALKIELRVMYFARL